MAIIDKFAEHMSQAFTYFMRLLGWALGLALYVLLGFHVYAFFEVVCPILKKRLGVEFGLIWICIGLTLLYNIVFNHFLAMTLSPSGPKDLQRIERIRKDTKQREHRKAAVLNLTDDKAVEDDRFDGLQKDVKRLMKYRTKTIKELEANWDRSCPKCEMIKPARTHHCSICDRCVFHMDHHCPWINNCVGLENYRFFLLFIFYLFIGTIYFAITIVSIWNHYSYVSFPLN